MQKSVPLYVCQSGYRYLPCIKFDTMQSHSVKSTRRSVFVQVKSQRNSVPVRIPVVPEREGSDVFHSCARWKWRQPTLLSLILAVHSHLPLRLPVSHHERCGDPLPGAQNHGLDAGSAGTTPRRAAGKLAGAGRCGQNGLEGRRDRKSTRLNSSHVRISYAVFCLKKKNRTDIDYRC